MLLQVGHLGLVDLLEAVADAVLGSVRLHDAAGDAAVLARRQSLGVEVVDAGSEAVLNHGGEELVAIVSHVMLS